MSRMENKVVMGYFAIDEKHHEALTSLVAPATSAHKLLDPFAGEGKFLEVAAQAWRMTPYANELDQTRAAQCLARFGARQAVQGDVERLSASSGAFSVGWFNPPYDHDAQARGNKRVEFRLLRHSWKWIQTGGLVLWAIYHTHLTEEAMVFLAQHTSRVDVWALPGKHLGEYDQIVVAGVVGQPLNPEAHYAHLVEQKSNPQPLTLQAEPVYVLPPPPKRDRFVFAPDVVDEQQGLRLLESGGAWMTNGFQALLATPPPPPQIVPVVAPRPGHTALVLAAGVADGAVIETAEYGRVALRGKTVQVEQVGRVEVESDPKHPDQSIKKTIVKLKPTTTLTLLGADGTIVEMDGDGALLGFITRNQHALATYLNTRFDPVYRFDLNGLGGFLGRIRLNGKYPLYPAQQHVIAALTKGFETRKGILLSGQMGTGKTAIGSSVTAAIASGAVEAARREMRPDQVVLVVTPPHLTEKWQRELQTIHPQSFIQRLDRHEEVKAFMEQAARLGNHRPKIGLIKRDLTKLGASWEVAVHWRTRARANWHPHESPPSWASASDRIKRERVPTCPHCGEVITYEWRGTRTLASASWLESSQRACPICRHPLWQEARDSSSRPAPGHRYAPKNPRYRIDRYLKQRYPDRIYLLIWDEIHEGANGSTGNGEAFGRLAGISQKVLGLTGTPFNGRSSSLFNLEYHLNPRVRQHYNWGGAERTTRKERGSSGFPTSLGSIRNQRGRAESRWVAQMGVRERVIEERPTYDSQTGAYTGTTTYERPYEESPGISPLLVAEMLDHTVYFSLKDLGKALPDYQEIALPVEMDSDTYAQYDRTRTHLKEYLIQRKWQGDTSFRGAYLQWAMGWTSTPYRATEIVHSLKHPMTEEVMPYVVEKIPSYGEDRVYAKEQALIDLLSDELEAGRPCVVYLRQTGTRDIQPRIESLIRQHVTGAIPYVLKNTVAAERREKVVEAERKKGVNVLITNPELVKTGLDLIAYPTLIFFELTFNLSTMMQASARAYRLNQTHAVCKTIYLYSEGTMEQTAVQLMSRKQRAAKLLTGEVGLTGLEALTEGEGSFEAALMDAITKDEALVDPTHLFTAHPAHAYDQEDQGFWQVASPPLASVTLPDEPDETPALTTVTVSPTPISLTDRVQAQLARGRVLAPDHAQEVVGRVVGWLEAGGGDPLWLTKYLRSHKITSTELLPDLVNALVALIPPPPTPSPETVFSPPSPRPHPTPSRRRQPNLLDLPDDLPDPIAPPRPTPTHVPTVLAPTQPMLFALPYDPHH